jgi:hypothetical protein
VITDFAGHADLSELFLPEGNAEITAYFNGEIILPNDTVTITDDLYNHATPISATVRLIQEDSLVFDANQVDVYYKSSGQKGKNADAPVYENASVSGGIEFGIPIQPDGLLDPLNRDEIQAHIVAYLSGEKIAEDTVLLDTRGDNYNHWTTTNRPGQAVSYVGIHWSDAPKFDSALSHPGPRIYTTFIGNSFSEIRYIPAPGTYTTVFDDGTEIGVFKGKIDLNRCVGLVEGDYSLDEDDGLTLALKYAIVPGMTFTTTGSIDLTVTVEDGVNYLLEGGKLIIRLDSVDGIPDIHSDNPNNLFECRMILGNTGGVQVISTARVGDGVYAVPWSSEAPGHKQFRP